MENTVYSFIKYMWKVSQVLTRYYKLLKHPLGLCSRFSFSEIFWLFLPSLSISNTLIASCGVRFLNSLAGSVCRLCRRGLTTLTGVFRKKGLRDGEPLTCCVMMPRYCKTEGSAYFSEIVCLTVFLFFTLSHWWIQSLLRKLPVFSASVAALTIM